MSNLTKATIVTLLLLYFDYNDAAMMMGIWLMFGNQDFWRK